MKTFAAGLLVCLWSAHSWAAAQPKACEKLWANLAELKERDEPLWAVSALPSQGVLPNLKMSALVYPDGTRFIPRSIEESNCFLDRILDRRTRRAIVAGAKRVAQDRSVIDIEEKLESLHRELDASMRRAAGLPEESEGMAYASVMTNLVMLYEVSPSPVEHAGPFLRHAYAQGLYTGHTIQWYIVLSYIDHLGVPALPVAQYAEYFRKQESSYAPPADKQPEGCSGGIDYRWPHITTRLSGQGDIPYEDAVHFGICRSSGRVWSYHYVQGWHEVIGRWSRRSAGDGREMTSFLLSAPPPARVLRIDEGS